MFETLFGGDLSVPVRFAIAFGVVLSLIALTFVGIRRFAGRRLPLSNGGRARQPRLGVLDAFAIDARRRLVLIRRDNVEHLIMIGGPNDVLVESEIVRAPAQAALAPQQTRRAPGENTRAAVAPPQGQVQQRPLPAPEQPAAMEPAESAPLRPAAFRNALQRPAEPAPAARAPAAPAAPARPAAPPPPPAPPRVQRDVAVEGAEQDSAKPKANIDPLYADIERKLGEALSRAPSSPPTAPPPARTSAPPPPARAAAPPPPNFERPAPPPSFERPAPSFSRPATPPPAPARPAAPPLRRPEPAAAPAPAAKDAGGKSHLDALEEEMASLLGRDRSS